MIRFPNAKVRILSWISADKSRKKLLLLLLVGPSSVANVGGDGDVNVDARGKADVFCAISGNLGSASERNIVLLTKAPRCIFVGNKVLKMCTI